jgi:copper transport protein
VFRLRRFGVTVLGSGSATWVTRSDYEGSVAAALFARLSVTDMKWLFRRVTAGRLAAAMVAAAALLVTFPASASAHAQLVSSAPKPDDALGTAPGVVVLEFSQALNPRLSAAAVTDPAHHRWPGSVTTGEEIRIPMATNVQGVYTVDWVTVSVLDGHRVAGAFRFGVGVSAAALTGTAAIRSDPQPVDVLVGVARWVEALALLLLVGQLLLARLASRPPSLAWVRPRFLGASLALSAGLVVVWAEATIASGGHSLAAYAGYFSSGLSEAARPLRLGFEALALLAVLRQWRGLPFWVAGALACLAASGHAADLEPGAYGIALNAVHLAAAGVWAGGVAALALTRPPGGWRSAAAGLLLTRFSPPALAAFAVTVAAGALQAAGQIGSLSGFVQTEYGAVLLAKIVLVGLMLPLSLMAWRLRRLHLRAEAGIAAAVVAAAALLAAFPLPPTAAVREAAAAAASASPAGLPQPGQVTLGGNAGSVLVGLTVDPGQPGATHVTVYLFPLQGADAAAALVANVTANGTTRALISCGSTCRQATLPLSAGGEVDVDVLGPGGGRAAFNVPTLPAPAGDALISRMQAVMHGLRTYEVSETLSSGIAVIHSEYASQAPDRSRWTVAQTSETVSIGTTQYTREAPDQPWRRQTDLPPLAIPSFVWDYFQPLTNARVIGQATVDGAAATGVAAFGSRSGTAIWFTFWVDGDGLVRRAEMHAPGHFMTDHYVRFNAPEDIAAPSDIAP